jgi:protein phosphatase 1L
MSAFLGVYDGHGGFATSDWLDKNLFSFVQDAWAASKDPEQAITKAFQTADSVLLSPTGWMGMGERGVGGSKCGSTAAVSCIYQVCLAVRLFELLDLTVSCLSHHNCYC